MRVWRQTQSKRKALAILCRWLPTITPRDASRTGESNFSSPAKRLATPSMQRLEACVRTRFLTSTDGGRQLMRLVRITSTIVMSSLLGVAASAYGQHDQQGEKQDRPQQQQDRHEQAKPEQRHAQQRPQSEQ